MADVFAEMMDNIQGQRDTLFSDKKPNQNPDWMEKFVKMPREDGALTVRMLGPTHGLKMPFVQTRLHSLIIGGKKRSYHCPNELVKEGNRTYWKRVDDVCPICDHYAWLWAQAEKAGGREAKAAQPYITKARAVKPYERFYYNAIVRDDPSQVGVKVLSIGVNLQKLIIQGAAGNPKIKSLKALGNVWDTSGKTGRDFMIVVETQGDYPNYNRSVFLDPSPLGTDEEIELWMSQAHDLRELRIVKTYDELKHLYRVHLGLEADTSSDFDPSDFEADNDDGDPMQVTRVKSVETPAPVKQEEEPPFDVDEPGVSASPAVAVEEKPSDDEILADADFLTELKNM